MSSGPENARPGEAGLLRGVLNYGLGSFVPQVVSFLLVPVYSRFLPPEELGIVELCVTVQVLMGILSRLGMTGSVSRHYFDFREGDELKDYITSVACGVAASSLVVCAVALLVGAVAASVLVPGVPFWPHLVLSILTAALLAPTDIQRRLLEARKESAYSAKLTAAMGSVAVIGNLVAVVILRAGAVGILTINLLVAVVFSVLALWRNADDLRGRPRMSHLKAALSYGLPLVPHHGAAWANQYVGRWVLAATTTTAAVGELGMASRLAAPLSLAIGAFATAYSPIYFGWRTALPEPESALHAKRVFNLLATVGAVAVAGAATIGVAVVRHLLPASYWAAAEVLPIVAGALLFQLLYSAVVVEVFFSKETKWISVIFLLAAATNLLVLTMYPGEGSAALAGAAQLAGAVVALTVASAIAGRRFPLPVTLRGIATVGLAVGASIAVPQLIGPRATWEGVFVLFGLFLVLSAVVVVLAGTGRPLREWAGLQLRRVRTGRREASSESN